MKRFLILTAFILLFAISVRAEDGTDATTPENPLEINFSEFCPYEKMQQLDTSKKYYSAAKQYWVKRKLEFEEHKAICLSQETDELKAEFISNMRNIEQDATKQYFAKEAQDINNSFSPVLNIRF